MAKDSLIGGIYNRPVAMGNLLHFMVGAITLVKAVIAGHAILAMVVAALLYSALAIVFAWIVFGNPLKESDQ